jgi:hypothetical protein
MSSTAAKGLKSKNIRASRPVPKAWLANDQFDEVEIEGRSRI